MSLTISPVRNARGEVIGASKIGRDISARIQAERELQLAHAKVLAASRAKDDFLAMLSHELRTPLNPVLLLASEWARSPELPPRVRADFDGIRRNIELEARLIDDMLDITRLSRGKLLLNLELVNAHTVLRDSINTVRGDMEEKKITLVSNLAAANPMVFADAVRLQQIFWNVLKNAVKFTPKEGTISVETESAKAQLTVRITDTGIGMDTDEINRIFEAFSQGAHVGFGGLGLGLAISRKLIELHHGAIRAASEGKGRGATFVIELPVQPKVRKVVAREKFPSGQMPLPLPEKRPAQDVRILLVEDHEPTRTALVHLLERRNFKVEAAGSLADARRLADAQTFNLLISDIGLPDGSGYELMEEFRKSHAVIGIALTGYGTEQDVNRSHAAGFVTHLTKPVRVESLDRALAAALAKA
jgi:CheY-like chemotaxis protein